MSNANKSEKTAIPVIDKGADGLEGTVAQAPAEKRTLRTILRGDLGFLPVIITLVVITIYFQVATEGVFLQARNLSNLVQQIVSVGIIAIAAVLVLLLGEIDLSLAAVASACSAVTATLSVYQGWNAWLAILAGLLTGTVIGVANGFFIAYLRVPSFIVTLAGSIGYAGFLLLVMGPQSTLIIRDQIIRDLAPTFLDPLYGYGLPIIAIAAYVGLTLWEQNKRRRMGLKVKSPTQLALRLGGATFITLLVVILLQSYNGVPQSGIIWMGLILVFWVLLTKTPFGRHTYAVGGSVEAARRAGINVTGLKIAIFGLASTLAAFAGIMLASRGTAVATQIDSTLLLRAIAAAVIGGVSLFGGRGSVWAVILGSLVIGSLENGLTLLNQEQSVKNVVQGIVLLLAVTLDAVVRRNSSVKGK